MNNLNKLLDLLDSSKPHEAASMVRVYGDHYEWLIGIGDDHVAWITMSEEAYRELDKLTKDK